MLIPPLEPDLQIVTLHDNRLELLQQLFRLILVQLIDILRERSQRKDTLPPGHRIRPHDRMDSHQLLPNIERTSPRLSVDLVLLGVSLRCLDEAVAHERRGQAFEELLVRFRKPVVELVPRCPEGVSTGFGELGQSERGVVSWCGLELDIGVPLGRVIATAVGLAIVGEHLLAGERADCADFGVCGAELVGVVQQRVDVQGGGGGFAG